MTRSFFSDKISRKRLNKVGDYMDIMEFKILNTAIERILNQEMAELDITYTQATVIGYLSMHKELEICQKDIEIGLGLTHPTVSSILHRLEEKNLIYTTPLFSDRRYKKIVLTNKSEEMTIAIKEKIEKISSRVFQGLDAQQQTQLGNMIAQIIKNIK